MLKQVWLFIFVLMMTCCVTTAEATQKFNGTIFFDDGSQISTEFMFRWGFKNITVKYENENVTIPTDKIKSIEVLSVEEGRYSKVNRRYYALNKLKIKLKNGMEVVSEVEEPPFCGAIFRVLRVNPLTKIKEEKAYDWVGQSATNPGQSNCYYSKKGSEKRVLKVVFE